MSLNPRPDSTLRPPGHQRTSTQAWKAGLALVTSQCHMQIRDVTAHRLGATNGEPRTQLLRPLAETDKEPERGAQGVSWGARSPHPRGRDSPGAGSGNQCAEVVMRPGVPGAPVLTAGTAYPGRAGRRQGSQSDARSSCGRCAGAHGTNPNAPTADCDVTKGPARSRQRPWSGGQSQASNVLSPPLRGSPAGG